MGGNLGKEYKPQSNIEFSEMIKKAYEKGTSNREITVEELVEEIKSDLIKMKKHEYIT